MVSNRADVSSHTHVSLDYACFAPLCVFLLLLSTSETEFKREVGENITGEEKQLYQIMKCCEELWRNCDGETWTLSVLVVHQLDLFSM